MYLSASRSVIIYCLIFFVELFIRCTYGLTDDTHVGLKAVATAGMYFVYKFMHAKDRCDVPTIHSEEICNSYVGCKWKKELALCRAMVWREYLGSIQYRCSLLPGPQTCETQTLCSWSRRTNSCKRDLWAMLRRVNKPLFWPLPNLKNVSQIEDKSVTADVTKNRRLPGRFQIVGPDLDPSLLLHSSAYSRKGNHLQTTLPQPFQRMYKQFKLIYLEMKSAPNSLDFLTHALNDSLQGVPSRLIPNYCLHNNEPQSICGALQQLYLTATKIGTGSHGVVFGFPESPAFAVKVALPFPFSREELSKDVLHEMLMFFIAYDMRVQGYGHLLVQPFGIALYHAVGGYDQNRTRTLYGSCTVTSKKRSSVSCKEALSSEPRVHFVMERVLPLTLRDDTETTESAKSEISFGRLKTSCSSPLTMFKLTADQASVLFLEAIWNGMVLSQAYGIVILDRQLKQFGLVYTERRRVFHVHHDLLFLLPPGPSLRRFDLSIIKHLGRKSFLEGAVDAYRYWRVVLKFEKEFPRDIPLGSGRFWRSPDYQLYHALEVLFKKWRVPKSDVQETLRSCEIESDVCDLFTLPK